MLYLKSDLPYRLTVLIPNFLYVDHISLSLCACHFFFFQEIGCLKIYMLSRPWVVGFPHYHCYLLVVNAVYSVTQCFLLYFSLSSWERDPLVDQNLFSHFTQFLEVSVLFFTELLIITTTIIIYSLIKIKSSVYGCGWGNKGLPLMHEFQVYPQHNSLWTWSLPATFTIILFLDPKACHCARQDLTRLCSISAWGRWRTNTDFSYSSWKWRREL